MGRPKKETTAKEGNLGSSPSLSDKNLHGNKKSRENTTIIGNIPLAVDDTFKSNLQIKKAFIKNGGEEWFFLEVKANNNFPGNFYIVENPYIK